MVKLASNRSPMVKAIDSTWSIIRTLYFAVILFLFTLIGMKKESNKYTKEELNYIIDDKMPFKRKPKDDDDDDGGKEGTKPKIVRGLGGGADCKS
ncbi:unnamed protein product (macronuclear) [Paramecium tetraurelia]|uniref:Chromosome undetermined scaffold_332, whole genome shotgun sequence n=1 Tax=Paramecium tetraurelia TaxID=5888 RepID=A0D124_PARTE|nr:uncharacterized protein GSPATT00039156001 [Paramecium tetraurelia]XP_001456739.1 uncharacterized protein GSPATT00022513001 [Paramecium tetraurelia]CAK76741.1 unnamed protein product [Paramecium tetraurelia]CAK89342.1 unnamed protein product [Paramecium tetraurelia]|eukprot:XP_001444138.1 hypothetical protein (macronuclear) [Paramecium tetraurelia strain d4-2]